MVEGGLEREGVMVDSEACFEAGGLVKEDIAGGDCDGCELDVLGGFEDGDDAVGSAIDGEGFLVVECGRGWKNLNELSNVGVTVGFAKVCISLLAKLLWLVCSAGRSTMDLTDEDGKAGLLGVGLTRTV